MLSDFAMHPATPAHHEPLELGLGRCRVPIHINVHATKQGAALLAERLCTLLELQELGGVGASNQHHEYSMRGSTKTAFCMTLQLA